MSALGGTHGNSTLGSEEVFHLHLLYRDGFAIDHLPNCCFLGKYQTLSSQRQKYSLGVNPVSPYLNPIHFFNGINLVLRWVIKATNS
jgi:hypothetical protein